MSIKVRLDNVDKLKKAMADLSDRVAKKAINSAIRAGGREIIKQSRTELRGAQFPYKTLRSSITQKILPIREFNVTSIIGPAVRYKRSKDGGAKTRIDPWYAHIVEYGTLGSRTEPLASSTKRKRKYNPMPQGLRAQPFMRPGFEKAKNKAMQVIRGKLWEVINREAKK